MHEISMLIKEVGIGIVGTGAIIYIALRFVDASLKRWDALIAKMDIFMSRVRDEHKASADAHKGLMDEHKELIQMCGRINGYKS